MGTCHDGDEGGPGCHSHEDVLHQRGQVSVVAQQLHTETQPLSHISALSLSLLPLLLPYVVVRWYAVGGVGHDEDGGRGHGGDELLAAVKREDGEEEESAGSQHVPIHRVAGPLIRRGDEHRGGGRSRQADREMGKE